MHLKEGEIRALIDQELAENARQRLAGHLAGCPACQARMDEMQARSERIVASLSGLVDPRPRPLSPGAAHARFEQRINYPDEKEKTLMPTKIFNRIPRFAWVTLIVVAVLAVALAFEPVRAVANSFLGLFRVEQVRLVRVDPAALQAQMGSSSQLEQMMAENVQFNPNGEMQETDDPAQASQWAGIPLRLPEALEGNPHFMVQPGGSLSFNVDIKLVESVLQDMDRGDIQLPRDLDGAQVDIVIPAGVISMYGKCDPEELNKEADPDEPPASKLPTSCTTLMQMPSPTISAPPGLNLAQIGEAYLQLLGMTAEEAASFARNVDWTTTFVIPVPRYNADYYDVQVDGVTATLALQPYRDAYALLWIKDSVLYVLSGPGNKKDALHVAGSLK